MHAKNHSVVWIVLAFGLAPSWVSAAPADERPNFLVIVSEDNGPEIGCYGEPYVKTPVLDKLASEGVRFENAYVPQAGCSQSRAAWLTGLYPHQNGQIGLATWKFRMYRDDTPNLVSRLRQAGYRTGIVGKLHVNPESAFPFHWSKIPGSNFGRKKLGDYAKFAGNFVRNSKKPFFLVVNYPDAHRPFVRKAHKLPKNPLTANDVKPLAYMGLDTPELREETANYYNCMSRLDTLIGDLLEKLDESGKADNTIIVYFGDHGADLLRGKRTSYEGGVRVPLIIRWPHAGKAGQVREELVSTLDLAPTLLAASGAESTGPLEGQSLLPLIEGKSPAWREYLFTEFHSHSAHDYYPQRTVRNARYKLIQNLLPGETNPGYNFTIGRFFPSLNETIDATPQPVRGAYERMKKSPEFELYDLENDPYEFTNLAESSEHREILSELQAQLSSWRQKTDDPLLDPKNVRQLQSEINACMVDGRYTKENLKLNYTDYFFDDQSAAKQE